MAASPHPLRLLVLGGSSEATALARALAGDTRFDATISLAGRTRNPAPLPLPTRIGGFGGASGLAHFLATQKIALLIDATHPFAAQISRNAAEAARAVRIPHLAIRRPEWRAQPGDHWIAVPDLPSAAAALGAAPRRVFLTIGQKDLAPFAAAPQHRYLIRAVDTPPDELLPPQATVITARGPFHEPDEIALLRTHEIECLVTKNSGGSATAAKLAAARALSLPVIMVARAEAATNTVPGLADALAWLDHHATTSDRGA
jgi:precorrin-6A/cobalt-precorrin-6A reductase